MARKHRPEITFHSGSFLDVLCNMVGILIILIAVVGMRVANKDEPEDDSPVDDAQQVAEIPAPPPVPAVTAKVIPPPEPIPELKPIIDPMIEVRRREREAKLAAYAAEVEAHERRSREKLNEWETQLTQVSHENQVLVENKEKAKLAVEETARLLAEETERFNKLAALVAAAEKQNADIHKTESQLQKMALDLMQRRQELQKELDAQQVAKAIRKPVYTVVAHDGSSGTNRRPILIECRADGLMFASEKIEISAKNLNDYSPEQNPLLAGTEALIDYWSLRDKQEGIQSAPYVLLIVRPGGTIGFYVAREYLEKLNQDYGYELVPDGADIKWPEADPQAVEICRAAVERASHERKVLGGLGGAFGRGRNPDSTGGGSGREPRSRSIGSENNIVGANGNFALEEVEKLRNGSPRDSIGMLSPEWNRQRQGLRSEAAGSNEQASSVSRLQAEEEAIRREMQGAMSQAQQNAGPGSPAATGRQGLGQPDSQTFNSRVESASRNGLSDQPSQSNAGQWEAGNGQAQGGASGMSSGAGSPKRAGDPLELPPSPIRERVDGMPQDGGKDRQWGKPNRGGSIGIEKELVLHLKADRVEIENGSSARIPDAISRVEFQELIATMIQVEANSWGDAPAKFVWRPRLKIVVHQGSHQQYIWMKELIQHWGFTSKVEQAPK
ncbi:hypothetical protein SH668x_002581 [Planctomicrobium sp. SH668]|uniref:hypothetical protein n=1 Tax=Planctomicrobium sp. SH668 TaxID=3448126 RepID=UPI003F5BBB02